MPRYPGRSQNYCLRNLPCNVSLTSFVTAPAICHGDFANGGCPRNLVISSTPVPAVRHPEQHPLVILRGREG